MIKFKFHFSVTYLKEDGAAHRGSLSPRWNRGKEDGNHQSKANRADMLPALSHTEAPLLSRTISGLTRSLSFPFQSRQKPLCFSFFLLPFLIRHLSEPDLAHQAEMETADRWRQRGLEKTKIGEDHVTYFLIPSTTCVQKKK